MVSRRGLLIGNLIEGSLGGNVQGVVLIASKVHDRLDCFKFASFLFAVCLGFRKCPQVVLES